MPVLVVPSITPFKADRVDHDAIHALTAFYRKKGVPGLFPLGTTGEFVMLSETERRDALESFVSAAQGEMQVIAHIGAATTREVIRLGEHAASIGITAAAVVTPYFFTYTQPELEAFYREVCAALPTLKIYAYTIPSRTGNTLEVSTVERLTDIENLVGIKDSSGDMNRLLDLLGIERLAVYAGADSLALPFMLRGGAGLVSGLGSAIPEVFAFFARALEQGDPAAQASAYRLIRSFNALLRGGSRLDYIRIALEWRGIETGHSRAPLPRAGGAEREALLAGLGAFTLEAQIAGCELEGVQ